MGCFDTTTTSETDIPAQTQQQKNFMDAISNAVLPSYMEQAGYSSTPATYNTYDETPEAIATRDKIAAYQKQLDALPESERRTYNPNLRTYSESSEAKRLRESIDDLNEQSQERAQAFTPYTSFSYEKKEPTVALQSIKDQYGIDSTQYKEARAAYGETQVVQEKQKAEIQQDLLDKIQKFVSGDFSITPEQEKWVQGQMAPIKTAIDELFKGGMEAVSKMKDQVSRTSMKVGDALRVVGQTIEQTGKDLDAVLTSTIATNKELLKMNIEDKTGEITKRISSAAIVTGRDPSDPEYSAEIQTQVAREIKYGTINLAQLEAQGKMGIAERTGSGREEIARAMARLAEQEGTKLEALTSEEYGLQQRKGGADVRLAESGSSMRSNIGMGLPPSQISVGSGFQSFDQAQAQQRLLNAAAPMSAIGYPFNLGERERYAQPTTTQTQQGGWQDWVNLGLDVGQTALSGYTAFGGGGGMFDTGSGTL